MIREVHVYGAAVPVGSAPSAGVISSPESPSGSAIGGNDPLGGTIPEAEF